MIVGWLMMAITVLPGCAPKVGTEGVMVKVKVQDLQKKPIPTAVIRHPDAADRLRVNAANGEWSGSVLYMEDGILDR